MPWRQGPAGGRWLQSCGILSLLLLAVGCGGGVSGTYTGTGVLEELTFLDGDRVELATMFGREEGSYTVEDDRVHITFGGETQIFAIDDEGCLDGGGMLGVLCKE